MSVEEVGGWSRPGRPAGAVGLAPLYARPCTRCTQLNRCITMCARDFSSVKEKSRAACHSCSWQLPLSRAAHACLHRSRLMMLLRSFSSLAAWMRLHSASCTGQN